MNKTHAVDTSRLLLSTLTNSRSDTMGDSVSFPLPDTASLPPKDAKVIDAVSATGTDASWDEFDKFFDKNEKAIEKCKMTDVRSIALGEKVSDIEQQIDSFSETTKVVLDGLAELGKIHPIIGAVVFAFSAVISMDLTRRENDRKVIAVMLEMQNMMCGIFQLRHLKHTHVQESKRDVEKTGLHQLLESIREDIKHCGSDLNYYRDQKFAFKLIKAKKFEDRFKTHVENFAKRRSELQTAVTVYIAGGVDQANVTITAVSTKLDSLEEKFDNFFHAFLRKLDTPQEKEAFRFFDQNNGVDNCINKHELLGRLLQITGDVLPESENKAGLKSDERIEKSHRVLRDEVDLDFEESLKLNTLRFERLLAIQNNNHERVIAQLEKQEEYQEVTLSKLDKLLYYLYPDTNLQDPEVRRIWEQMGLKTSVKAKTFVLTFRDYYQHDHSTPLALDPVSTASHLQSVDNTTSAPLSLSTNLNQPGSVSPSGDPNAWLLEYIDAAHVRSIVEAMDADGSGFISVKEINTFALARPKGWSLLQWMVYWAAGWHINITQYRNKIYNILIQMHELLPLLHTANRVFVDDYLDSYSVHTVEAILRCTRGITDSQQSQITELAQLYADAQESALRANLKEISYVISSVADVTLIAGPARAESWIYPLLYLLLERHLAVLNLGKTMVYDPREITTHRVSLESVVAVFQQRKDVLTAIFSQIYQNVAARFETFAYGMFYPLYRDDTEITPAKNTLLKMTVKRTMHELLHEMPNKSGQPAALPDTTVLALTKGTPLGLEDLNLHGSTIVKTNQDIVPHPLDGYWSVTFREDGYSFSELGLFHFMLSIASDGTVTGFGEAYFGKLRITGTVAFPDNELSTGSLELNVVVDDTADEQDDHYVLHGTHNAERDVVTGSWQEFDLEESLSKASGEQTAGAVQDTQQDQEVLNLNNATTDLADAGNAAEDANSEDESFLEFGTFTMRRTPAHMYQLRRDSDLDSETDSSVLAKNRWKFAIEVTKFQVQIKNFSWEYIRARFVERRLWLDLTAAFDQDVLPDDRFDLMWDLTELYSPSQSRIYEAVSNYLSDREYGFKIGRVWCDYCRKKIVCNRYRCITCTTDGMNNQVDLCADNPECIKNTSSNPEYDFVHTSSHTLLRSTSKLHAIYYPRFLTQCRTRSENIKRIFRTLAVKKKTTKKISKSSKGGKSGHTLQTDKAADIQPLSCVCCMKVVSLPCWICATCATDTAVCLECEVKRAKIVKYDNWVTMHSHDHHLLRISDSTEVQSREVNNARLQKELIGITTDLKSLEEKVTSHLRTASKVSTALKRLTSDGEIVRVSGDTNTNGAPVVNEEAVTTATASVAHLQDTVSEEENNNSSSESSSSSDTEGDDVPDIPRSADPQSPRSFDVDAEASGHADPVAAGSSGTDLHSIPGVESLNQESPVVVPPAATKASIITPTPTETQILESFTPGSSQHATLSEMGKGHELVPEPGPEPTTTFVEQPLPTSEARQFAHHLISIDSRISSLETHIDARISSLGTDDTNARISAIENRLNGLESQLGEIISLLKQNRL